MKSIGEALEAEGNISVHIVFLVYQVAIINNSKLSREDEKQKF